MRGCLSGCGNMLTPDDTGKGVYMLSGEKGRGGSKGRIEGGKEGRKEGWVSREGRKEGVSWERRKGSLGKEERKKGRGCLGKEGRKERGSLGKKTSRPGASNGQQFPCPAFDLSIIIDF